MGDRRGGVSALPEVDCGSWLGIEMKGTCFGLVLLREESLGIPWEDGK